MNSDGQTIFNGAAPTPKPAADTPQSTPAVPVFNSSDIDKSKAGSKNDYFVNLKRSNAFDRLAQKIDQKKTTMELEAKRRAEAEAAAKANKPDFANPDDRFIKKETSVVVPEFVKGRLTNGIAEPGAAPRPTTRPVASASTPASSAVSAQPATQSQSTATSVTYKKTKDNRTLYGILAGLTALLAAAFIIWQLLPREVIVKKQTSVAAPIEEKTLLDEITERRLKILPIFESEGAEAGIAEYGKYVSEVTESKTLSLIYAWESLDLYRLYRGEYIDIIKQCIAKAEELDPSEGTATLLYLSEHEFGNDERASEYRALVMERQVSEDE